MTILHDYRLFPSVSTYGAHHSQKSTYLTLKFKRAFEFLQLLLFYRIHGIDARTFPPKRRTSKCLQPAHKNCEVFLGGSCNPTTWRYEHAILYFEGHYISYYNPQVDHWSPDLVQIEHEAKESATLLFFVIDHDTRSLAAIAEVCYLAARGRNIVVVINSMPENRHGTKFFQQKSCVDDRDDQDDYHNVCAARRTLRIVLRSLNVPVFDQIRLALEYATFILDITKQPPMISSEDLAREKKTDADVKVLPSSNEGVSPALSARNQRITSLMQNGELTSLAQLLMRSRSTLNNPPILHRTQISVGTNESDDDGYASLFSSYPTRSRSSSSLGSDAGESSLNGHLEAKARSWLCHLLSSVLSILCHSIPHGSAYVRPNPVLSTLCALPFRRFQRALTAPSSPVELSTNFDRWISTSKNCTFDLYIASGEFDACWLDTAVVPVLEDLSIFYTKRSSASDEDELDNLYDFHIRQQAHLLYYLINGHERLSHLITELAFLIGERKHRIIVYLEPKIAGDCLGIMTKSEKQDLERSRRYLEDLAHKEDILLCYSRDQSWQHVLAFFLQE